MRKDPSKSGLRAKHGLWALREKMHTPLIFFFYSLTYKKKDPLTLKVGDEVSRRVQALGRKPLPAAGRRNGVRVRGHGVESRRERLKRADDPPITTKSATTQHK